jgi:predicted house-cleaning noncanonical NTP pyrophosphatase (MazG superfamily)
MRQTYDKLVRDRIPEIIRHSGKTFETSILSEYAYRAALLTKLVEEANEAALAGPEDLVTELADLLEVIDATIRAFGLTREAVERVQRQRHQERGGFDGRVQLLWTE